MPKIRTHCATRSRSPSARCSEPSIDSAVSFAAALALLERQLAPDLAQRLRQRPFGTLRTVSRDDAAIADQAHIDEGQHDARRRREGRWENQTESGEGG